VGSSPLREKLVPFLNENTLEVAICFELEVLLFGSVAN
jgi:hypothetical protein